MGVRLRNLQTSRPVIVPLNTGASLRLSPGQVSDELPDVAVADSPKVDKLLAQGLIDVEEANTEAESEKVEEAEPEPESRPRSRRRGTSAGR
jgi:hypothetical protein